MTKDLTKGKPLSLILRFALPLLCGMLFQQLYNVVDTMIVGRLLGVNALAGVGATGSINFLVLGFTMGVCAGFVIPVAQRFGAGDYRRMREYIAGGVWLSAGMAAAMTLLTVVFCRAILEGMNTPEDCIEQSYAYISVIFTGIPFAFLYNMTSGCLRSLGDSRTPLLFLILSSVLNVVLDIVMIVIFGLGVRGAALATVISQAVSGLSCLAYIAKRVPLVHVSGREWAPRRDRMLQLCGYGLPMGMQYTITAIGSVILQTAINGLGSVAVAAVTASGKVYNFLSTPHEALGSTMATYTAQNVGAGRTERLNRGLLSAIVLGVAYSLCAFAAALLLGRQAAMLFVGANATEQLLDMAHLYMTVTTAFYPLLVLVNVVRFSIQGMGYSLLAMSAGVLEMVARALTGLFIVPAFGFTGAALGTPLAWILADLFLIPAYLHCRRELIARMGHGAYSSGPKTAVRKEI